MDITPFTVAVPETELDDLLARLGNTRWPADVATDWSRGVPTAYARELADVLGRRVRLAGAGGALNTLPQFTTEIDGQTIHFVHVQSEVPAHSAPPAPRLPELVRRVDRG